MQVREILDCIPVFFHNSDADVTSESSVIWNLFFVIVQFEAVEVHYLWGLFKWQTSLCIAVSWKSSSDEIDKG